MAFQDDDIKPPRPLPFDYDRQTRFTDYQKNNPAGPDVRGVDLDAEFDDVERAMDETQSRLRIIQRDDGRLRNRVVTRDTLDPSIAIGFSPPLEWEPEKFYTLTSSVFFEQRLYLSREDHVSDPISFQTDLDAGRWELAVDFRELTDDAEAARDLARQWANELEDVEVLPGEFSANHFRLKAAASATQAETAETGALSSAAAASTSETNAANSETAAATSEANAAASETAAATSETNAATSETNAAASLADFRSRYYGELASDPTTDPNGDPINAGDLYWSTSTDTLRIYNGTTAAWQDAGASTAGLYQETATAGQTEFTITGGYTVGFILVFLNGVRLSDADFTADDGSTVVLATGATADDVFSALSFGTFDVANALTQSQIGTNAGEIPGVDEILTALDTTDAGSGFGPIMGAVGRGAIVESGTNANGSFVRWENGEQVCRGVFSSASSGGSASTTLPASFVSNGYSVSLTTQSVSENDARFSAVVSIGASSFTAQTWIDDGTRSANGGPFIAWGFWK